MYGTKSHLIPLAIVGKALENNFTNINARRVMSFAAGIEAIRTLYFDDVALAPPSMIVALEWPLLNGPRYRELLRAPQQVMERAIHIEQASTFYGPIRAGVTVRTSGLVESLTQSSRGVTARIALRTVADSGELLVSSLFTALILDSELDGESATAIDRRHIDQLKAADFQETRAISLLAGHIYTECSGIWNPIHTERHAAQRAGLSEPIMHGTWTWASAMERAIDWWCDGLPDRLASWSASFVAPVFPGRSIEFIGAGEGEKLRVDVRQEGRTCMRAEGRLKP